MNEWNASQPSHNPPGHDYGADDISLGRMPTESIAAFDLLGDSWTVVKENVLETIGGLLLAFGVSMGVQTALQIGLYLVLMGGIFGGAALGQVNETLGTVAMVGGMGVSYAAMLTVMIVVQTLSTAAYQLFLLRLVRGQAASFNDLRAIKPLILPLLGVGFLNFIAIMGGSLFFIVPGIVLALGFAMATFVVLDKNLGAVDAMKASWRIMTGHKMSLLFLSLLLGVVNIGGMLACGMGTLVTMPLSMVAVALFYNRIAVAGNAYIELAR